MFISTAKTCYHSLIVHKGLLLPSSSLFSHNCRCIMIYSSHGLAYMFAFSCLHYKNYNYHKHMLSICFMCVTSTVFKMVLDASSKSGLTFRVHLYVLELENQHLSTCFYHSTSNKDWFRQELSLNAEGRGKFL